MNHKHAYRTPARASGGTLPTKAAGAHYSVVLRQPDFSLVEVAVQGSVGGSGPFPVPQMGDQCACCNAPATESVPFDASTDKIQVPAIAVPTCAVCSGHMVKSTTAAQLVGAGMCVVAGGAVWSAMNESWALFAACLVGGAALSGSILHARQSRVAMAMRGHHPHLEIMVRIKQCALRTTNRRLVEELVARHTGEVYRVR